MGWKKVKEDREEAGEATPPAGNSDSEYGNRHGHSKIASSQSTSSMSAAHRDLGRREMGNETNTPRNLAMKGDNSQPEAKEGSRNPFSKNARAGKEIEAQAQPSQNRSDQNQKSESEDLDVAAVSRDLADGHPGLPQAQKTAPPPAPLPESSAPVVPPESLAPVVPPESLAPVVPPESSTPVIPLEKLAAMQADHQLALDKKNAPDEVAVPFWQLPPSLVDHKDPLVTSLSMLASALERPISPEALIAGLPHDGGEIDPVLAITAAERAGLTARLLRRPKVKDINKLALPCVLLLKGRNSCLLTKILPDGQCEVVGPEGLGPELRSMKDVQEQHSGYAIFARAEYRFDARASDIQLRQPRAWFWGTLLKFRGIYSHVLIATLTINSFAIVGSLFTMNVYDRVVPNQAVDTLAVLAVGVTIAYLFDFLMRNLRAYFVDAAGKSADLIISARLVRQILGMKLGTKPGSTGALAHNMRDFEQLREFFSSGTIVAFVDMPFAIIFILLIGWIAAPVMAFVVGGAALLVLTVGIFLQKPLRQIIQKTHKETSQKHSMLFETIDGLETIKTSVAEGRIQRAWERFVRITGRSAGQAHLISSFGQTFVQFITNMTTVTVICVGVFLIGKGEMTMGALIATSILSGRSLQPMAQASALLNRLAQSRVSMVALESIIKAPIERPEDRSFLPRQRVAGRVDFRELAFSYPQQEITALQNISFSIAPGERVGLLGRVGSGKSTVGRMVLNLYEPTGGAVLVDGTDVRQIDPADLRRNIAYVSQDNYLFFGTIRENITFGAPHMEDEAVERAAEIAGVLDFTRQDPLGLDRQVGERGTGLSGGQRQAVTIARALLLDPAIIVLDEPTSSMDNSSEAAFRARLEHATQGRTLILITHRGSLLSVVDRLILLDRGHLIADGPREEVLKALREGRVRSAS